MKKVILSALVASAALIANTITLEQKNDKPFMVITNSNLALVNETRFFNVPTDGRHNLLYKNVPKSLIPSSVFTDMRSVHGNHGVSVYSQKHNTDIISMKKLLDYNLGKKINYKIHSKDDAYSSILKLGTLVSVHPVMVQEVGDDDIYQISSKDIIFKNIPPSLSVQPNLSWDINSRLGDKRLNLTYLTRGIGWNANYVIFVDDDEKSGYLRSFITIKNNSGKSYNNLRVKCLAGDINVNQVYSLRRKSMSLDVVQSEAMAPTRKSFGGYHLYSIPQTIDLGNNEMTQVQFINKKVDLTKSISYQNNFFNSIIYRTQPLKMKFSQSLTANTDNINTVLPAGAVKIYQRDSDEGRSDPIFLGESRINNTPMRENVKITYGTNFDVTGQIGNVDLSISHAKNRLSNNSLKHKKHTGSYSFTVKNSSKKSQEVFVDLKIHKNIQSIDLSTNCTNTCSLNYSKKGAFYSLKVPASSTRTIRTSFNIVE